MLRFDGCCTAEIQQSCSSAVGGNLRSDSSNAARLQVCSGSDRSVHSSQPQPSYLPTIKPFPLQDHQSMPTYLFLDVLSAPPHSITAHHSSNAQPHFSSAHLVKAASHSLVEAVWDVGGSEDQHARLVGVDPLHLHQELGLYAPRRLALALATAAAEGIYLRTGTEAAHAEQSASMCAHSQRQCAC